MGRVGVAGMSLLQNGEDVIAGVSFGRDFGDETCFAPEGWVRYTNIQSSQKILSRVQFIDFTNSTPAWTEMISHF